MTKLKTQTVATSSLARFVDISWIYGNEKERLAINVKIRVTISKEIMRLSNMQILDNLNIRYRKFLVLFDF